MMSYYSLFMKWIPQMMIQKIINNVFQLRLVSQGKRSRQFFNNKLEETLITSDGTRIRLLRRTIGIQMNKEILSVTR